MRKTKIIATLGPACADGEILAGMIKAGMNVARINMSHATHEEHASRIATVKKLRRDLSVPVALMLDTRGPEIRLGMFENDSAEVVAGDSFEIVNEPVTGNSHRASVSCADFYKLLHKGDHLLINDGLIRMQVKEIADETVKLEVVIGGVISNHKSINVPGVVLNMPYLSDQDKNDLLFGIQQDVDFIAASFVSTANDIRVLKNFLLQNGGEHIEVIAKIESSKGVDNIDEILALADGIMVARGDLGVEVPFVELPAIQKSLIKKARAAGKRVITATEMLESMITKPRPTRAETSRNFRRCQRRLRRYGSHNAVGRDRRGKISRTGDKGDVSDRGVYRKFDTLPQAVQYAQRLRSENDRGRDVGVCGQSVVRS